MAQTYTFQIVTLPKLRTGPENEDRSIRLAEKFRGLRLKSLKEAADAFASNYEKESKYGLDLTLQRMANAKAAHFIALRKLVSEDRSPGDGDDVDRIISSDWVGMVVLLGPEEGSELSVPSANLDPFPRMTAGQITQPEPALFEKSGLPNSLHFHINATFVDPSARGGGLGQALIDAALRRADAEAAKINANLRVTLSVFTHNVAARKLYERAGFKVLKEVQARSRPEFVAVHMERSVAADP